MQSQETIGRFKLAVDKKGTAINNSSVQSSLVSLLGRGGGFVNFECVSHSVSCFHEINQILVFP